MTLLAVTKKPTFTFRPYQDEINNLTNEFLKGAEDRARIYAPTASGKTVNFTHTVKTLRKTTNNTNKIEYIVIVHPLLALSDDQQGRIRKALKSDNNTRIISFRSGRNERTTDSEGREELCTTDIEKVEQDIYRTNKSDVITRMVFFTTYKSLGKLCDVKNLHIDLMICDESHNLAIHKKYNKNYLKVDAKKTLLYTASPIDNDSDTSMEGVVTPGHGLDNEDMYGKLLIFVSPFELQSNGWILPPQLNWINIKTNGETEDDEGNTIPKIEAHKPIIDSYCEFQQTIKKDGAKLTKMLVTSAGSSHINDVNKNIEHIRREIRDKTGDLPNIYTIMSCKNGIKRNGEVLKKTRKETLEMIQSEDENCIVVHYDTLSEGIDLDSLNCTLLLRKVSIPKLIQLIGRVCRPFKDDLVNGNVINMKTRIKKFGYVAIALINGEETITGKTHEVLTRLADSELIKDKDDIRDLLVSAIDAPLGTNENGDSKVDLKKTRKAPTYNNHGLRKVITTDWIDNSPSYFF